MPTGHQRHPPSLVKDVSLQRDHVRIIQCEHLPFEGIHDAPVDHLAEHGDLAELFLELRIGLRVGVRRIRVALIAGDGVGIAEPAVEETIALIDDGHVLLLPTGQILLGELICPSKMTRARAQQNETEAQTGGGESIASGVHLNLSLKPQKWTCGGIRSASAR
ncbi:hypothetical protein THIOKS12970016 [Thiocapsa sp. KS1]|nr:hypothetical protein THIOKS12970016 [Thiocapsa sp. KS1]